MEISPSALGDSIHHHVCIFHFHNCCIILNSFGDYYLDFQFVKENFSDVFT